MMVQEGYDKACGTLVSSGSSQPYRTLQYKGLPFKLANFDKWIVIISGPKLVEELRQAPDDTLSFSQGVAEVKSDHDTFGTEFKHFKLEPRD